jgi:hypothetical protein
LKLFSCDRCWKTLSLHLHSLLSCGRNSQPEHCQLSILYFCLVKFHIAIIPYHSIQEDPTGNAYRSVILWRSAVNWKYLRGTYPVFQLWRVEGYTHSLTRFCPLRLSERDRPFGKEKTTFRPQIWKVNRSQLVILWFFLLGVHTFILL